MYYKKRTGTTEPVSKGGKDQHTGVSVQYRNGPMITASVVFNVAGAMTETLYIENVEGARPGDDTSFLPARNLLPRGKRKSRPATGALVTGGVER